MELRADKANNNKTINWNNSIRSSWVFFVEAKFKSCLGLKIVALLLGERFSISFPRKNSSQDFLLNLIGQSGFVHSILNTSDSLHNQGYELGSFSASTSELIYKKDFSDLNF